ncbi:MAG: ATP-binding protein [Planctomycetia bacterium]|nr:ATP-binding protein [Planctomycetia bacterium]
MSATELSIPSDLAEARRVQGLIEEALQASAFSEHDIFAIKLALEEALVNAIKHGNQMDPDKRVYIIFQVTTDRFEIRITDEGEGFNPEDVPDPTDERFIDRPSGRGLLLMRGFMTTVEYHGKGNSVSMSKVREISP